MHLGFSALRHRESEKTTTGWRMSEHNGQGGNGEVAIRVCRWPNSWSQSPWNREAQVSLQQMLSISGSMLCWMLLIRSWSEVLRPLSNRTASISLAAARQGRNLTCSIIKIISSSLFSHFPCALSCRSPKDYSYFPAYFAPYLFYMVMKTRFR